MVRALVVALLFLPLFAFASVTVRDVAYDVEGSDTGREWVEFYTDTLIPDIRTWRFLEGGTKHKIHGTSGAVPPGTAFVLAADAVSYRAEHAGYTGLVFDTAMSLSNSGETISLLDASSTVVVSHTYVAAPKSVAEKPVAQKKTKAVTHKSEPRVLGVATSSVVERGQLVAAAIEAPSRGFAWVAFGLLATVVVGGVVALLVLGRQ